MSKRIVKIYWLFRSGTIKKIQPIGAQYGRNYRPTSKQQYDDFITGLNFSATLQSKVNRITVFYTYDTLLKGSYKFIGYFKPEPLKKSSPIGAHYGKKH